MHSEIVQIKSFPLRSLFELTLTAVVLRTSLWGTIFRIVRKLAWIFSICIRGIIISPSTVTFWKDLESQPLQELLLSGNPYISDLPAPCFVVPFSSPFSVDERVRLCLQRTGALGSERRSRVWTRPGKVKTLLRAFSGPSFPALLLLLLSKYSFGACDVRVLCWVSKPRRFSWAVFLVCRKRGALHGACLGTVRIVQGGGNPSGVGAQFERQLP